MGFGIKELVVVLVIVALVFGTKKIKGVGSDVGGWIRDFKKAMKEEPVAMKEEPVNPAEDQSEARTIDSEAVVEKEQV
jgi:sec-independent protein translocase protein TatA